MKDEFDVYAAFEQSVDFKHAHQNTWSRWNIWENTAEIEMLVQLRQIFIQINFKSEPLGLVGC